MSRKADLYELWKQLEALELATPNIGLVGDIIACPGLDYCALANARSIPIAQEISKRFADLTKLHDIGELKIKISGCINACGHHHVGHIGILGVDKNGEEFYQITLGGSADENAAIGDIVGPAFGATEVVDAVETIVDTYLARAQRRRALPRHLPPRRHRALQGEALCRSLGRPASVDDPWLFVQDEEPLPEAGAVIVTLARWQANRDQLAARPTPLGLRLKSDQPPSLIAAMSSASTSSRSNFRSSRTGAPSARRGCCASATASAASCAPSATCCATSWRSCAAAASTAYEIPPQVDAAAWLSSLGGISVVYQPATDERASVLTLRHGTPEGQGRGDARAHSTDPIAPTPSTSTTVG